MTWEHVLNSLKDLQEDSALPKTVQAKVTEILTILTTSEERSLGVSRALAKLEVIADNAHMDSNTRVQLLNVVSLLEGI